MSWQPILQLHHHLFFDCMKKIFFTLLFFVAVSSLFAQKKYYPQVLIELYSSEGCESCPYADAFTKEILFIADSVKQPVFVLDYHVDIWDRSGWKDPYSDSAYSRRQFLAANRVGQPAIFTPMIFVNGLGGLPGAAKGEVGFYINNSLKEPREHNVVTTANVFEGKNTLSIDYEIDGNTDSLEIHFALIEKHIFNKVTAGENHGKTLEHHNVVRKFATQVVKSNKGHYELSLPKDAMADLKKFGLITFLQWKKGGYVFAVDELLFK